MKLNLSARKQNKLNNGGGVNLPPKEVARVSQCKSVYYLNGKKCSREEGHAGEHCHIIWDRNEGERREWWKDDYSVKNVGDTRKEGELWIRKVM